MKWVRGVFTSKIREMPLTQIPQIWTHGKEEHLNLLKQETAVWNEWRIRNSLSLPDLSDGSRYPYANFRVPAQQEPGAGEAGHVFT
jgi:hypothetical protein